MQEDQRTIQVLEESESDFYGIIQGGRELQGFIDENEQYIIMQRLRAEQELQIRREGFDRNGQINAEEYERETQRLVQEQEQTMQRQTEDHERMVQQYRQLQQVHGLMETTRNVFESIIEESYDKEDEQVNQEEEWMCCICLRRRGGEKWRCGQCNNIYHSRCIQNWRRRGVVQETAASCPTCREQI